MNPQMTTNSNRPNPPIWAFQLPLHGPEHQIQKGRTHPVHPFSYIDDLSQNPSTLRAIYLSRTIFYEYPQIFFLGLRFIVQGRRPSDSLTRPHLLLFILHPIPKRCRWVRNHNASREKCLLQWNLPHLCEHLFSAIPKQNQGDHQVEEYPSDGSLNHQQESSVYCFGMPLPKTLLPPYLRHQIQHHH